MDDQITWGYIVQKMQEEYGIGPHSEEQISMALLEARLDLIWWVWFKNKKSRRDKK